MTIITMMEKKKRAIRSRELTPTVEHDEPMALAVDVIIYNLKCKILTMFYVMLATTCCTTHKLLLA